ARPRQALSIAAPASAIIHCPACRTPYRVSTEFAGQTMRCQKCPEVFPVEFPEPLPEAGPVTPDSEGLASHPGTTSPPPIPQTTERAARRGEEGERDYAPRQRPRDDDRVRSSSKAPLVIGFTAAAVLVIGGGVLAYFLLREDEPPRRPALLPPPGNVA